ncbi:hypothetical protein [Nonomuraea typhae]|uniref:hypothetical protein n=1 Tax=Nonomuraea typhae TaxID=2603600 RepID=UPI0012F82A13|nr:hypothetical protein [Nonomuraea typhae]
MGKTALGVHWAHLAATQFVDGCLYVDFSQEAQGEAVTVAGVLGRLLRGLGVAPEAVPATFGDRLALYRSRTSRRRLLLMFDNYPRVLDPELLLPASRDSLVAVISRQRLARVVNAGAVEVKLEPFDDAAGVDLLREVLGSARLEGQGQAALELTRLCAGVPLALRVSANRVRLRRSTSVATAAARLSASERRLALLSDEHEGRAMSEVLDASYADLSEVAARVLRCMGLVEGTEFEPGAVGAMAGLADHETEDALESLADHALVDIADDGRARVHDLIHLYAREQAERVDTPRERAHAISAFISWYRSGAGLADHAVRPDRLRLADHTELLSGTAQPFTTKTQALDWLERELPNLMLAVRLAAKHGRDHDTVMLCDALWALFLHRKHYAAWIESHDEGVAAAVRLADPRAEGRLRCQLGRAHLERGEYALAAEQYAQAERAAQRSDWDRLIASAVEFTGRLYLEQADYERAVVTFTRSWELHHALRDAEGKPDVRGSALQRHHLGQALIGAGHLDAALRELDAALDGMIQAADEYNQARVRMSLGKAYHRLGHNTEAESQLQRALHEMEESKAHAQIATIRMSLADLAMAAGDPAACEHHLQMALEAARVTAGPELERIQKRLDDLRPGPENP